MRATPLRLGGPPARLIFKSIFLKAMLESRLCFVAILEGLEEAFQAIGSIYGIDVRYFGPPLILLQGCASLALASRVDTRDSRNIQT